VDYLAGWEVLTFFTLAMFRTSNPGIELFPAVRTFPSSIDYMIISGICNYMIPRLIGTNHRLETINSKRTRIEGFPLTENLKAR